MRALVEMPSMSTVMTSLVNHRNTIYMACVMYNKIMMRAWEDATACVSILGVHSNHPGGKTRVSQRRDGIILVHNLLVVLLSF